MKDYCYGCDQQKHEIDTLKAENSSMRLQLGIIKRAVSTANFEKVDNMNSFNLEHATRLLVLEALDRCNGNRELTAELLGVARSTLFEYLKKYKIQGIAIKKYGIVK